MSDSEVARFYDAAWQVCKLWKGKAPPAAFVQQLVQAWRELARREACRVGGKAKRNAPRFVLDGLTWQAKFCHAIPAGGSNADEDLAT